LALACDKILLVDDRNSAVSFPEVPLLGVLPGTGGLTRITDKRKIRRDRTDVFSTIAEGVKGKRAVEWNLVDGLAPLSRWEESVTKMARELADSLTPRAQQGVQLGGVELDCEGDEWRGKYVSARLDRTQRTAELTLSVPESVAADENKALAQGAQWWLLRAFRELDLILLELRMNEPEIALVLLRVKGSQSAWRTSDELLAKSEHWFVVEVRHFVKRVLKRLDNTAKSLYAVAEEGSNFVGTGLELALACDRLYLLNDPDAPVSLGATAANGGMFPMANGLSRLETRFLAEPETAKRIASEAQMDAELATELGLATFSPDSIDWEDELRLAIEERAAFSPDALTGMDLVRHRPVVLAVAKALDVDGHDDAAVRRVVERLSHYQGRGRHSLERPVVGPARLELRMRLLPQELAVGLAERHQHAAVPGLGRIAQQFVVRPDEDHAPGDDGVAVALGTQFRDPLDVDARIDIPFRRQPRHVGNHIPVSGPAPHGPVPGTRLRQRPGCAGGRRGHQQQGHGQALRPAIISFAHALCQSFQRLRRDAGL
jgi:enoyl-CoA hydratase/carnithine racemase